MRAAAIGLFVSVIGGPALAGPEQGSVMTPDAFRALVEGRTVHYTLGGEYYGSERFYGNDRATWQTPSGDCDDGHFWDVKSELCFSYGNTSCWLVYETDEQKRRAVSRDGLSVDISHIDNRPLRCEGNPLS